MKKILVFLAAFLIVAGVSFAEESVLINFSELLDDADGENQATMVDFSSVAGTRFTDEEKEAMNTSLYIPNWQVRLSSSSRNVTNDSLSYVRSVTVGENSKKFAGEEVMGVRVHYPEARFNSYAWVKPPFEIPAYATAPNSEDEKKGNQFTGYGVLKNIGAIKTISVDVYGLNFPMHMAIVLREEDQSTREIPFGSLEFDGWRKLTWENPNYVTAVRNREIKKYPLYPVSGSSITLDSLQFFRDAMHEGGDFITYVKDIVVTYDLAVLEDVNSEINNERIWGILEQREEDRRQAELRRLGNMQVYRYLEKQKMHQEPEEETEE